MNSLRVELKPDEVFNYFQKHKLELEDKMHIIACSDTDDFDKKSFLFLTNVDGNLFLSLEAPGVIVDSEYCSTNESTIKAVNKLIFELSEL